MPDEPVPTSTPGAGEAPASCPWCSAPLARPDATECSSCGAHVAAAADNLALPGVTELDAAFVTGGSLARNPRSRLNLPFIGTDEDNPVPTDDELTALATPDLEVRREMLRLELAARIADLEREARAIESDRGLLADDEAATGDDDEEPGADAEDEAPAADEAAVDDEPAADGTATDKPPATSVEATAEADGRAPPADAPPP